jgi:hypothetical protein
VDWDENAIAISPWERKIVLQNHWILGIFFAKAEQAGIGDNFPSVE